MNAFRKTLISWLIFAQTAGYAFTCTMYQNFLPPKIKLSSDATGLEMISLPIYCIDIFINKQKSFNEPHDDVDDFEEKDDCIPVRKKRKRKRSAKKFKLLLRYST